MQSKSILITIDVEDWFQVENLRPWFPHPVWNQQKLRVEQNTHKLLDLLDSITLNTNLKNPKATFFTLGWIAKRLPGLVREIHARGHEVASHGNNHLMCNQLDEIALKEDLSHSKIILEDIVGQEVKGYRAPNFSITDSTLNLVRSTGYAYDSSYNNFTAHGRYGKITLGASNIKGATYKIGKDFMEIPISNMTVAGQIIPWGGGGYFRFFPFPIFKTGIQRILKKTDAYIFYIHPWEIDPHQPRVKDSKGLSAWRHYLNLDKTHQRMQNLITSFTHCKFPTCSQYQDDVNKPIKPK